MSHLPIEFFARREAELLALLGELVNCESPSTEKPAVDSLGRRLAEILGGLPGTVETVPQAQAGDHLLYRWGGDERPLLILCHMDTVFDLGTAAQRPFRVEGERAYGPGVLEEAEITDLDVLPSYLGRHAVTWLSWKKRACSCALARVPEPFFSEQTGHGRTATGHDPDIGQLSAYAWREHLTHCQEKKN